MRRWALALLLTAAAVTTACAEQVPTKWGEWQYLRNVTALETSEHLVLYGQTDAGVAWVLTRNCHTGVPKLQSKVQAQGEAVDLDRVYLLHHGRSRLAFVYRRHPAGHEHDHLQQRRPLCRGRAQQVGVPGVLPQLGRRHFPRSAVRKRRR